MTRATLVGAAIGAAALLLLLAVGAGLLSHSRWGRVVRGISTLVVANESSAPLQGVRVSFVPAGSAPTSQAFDIIAPGESRAIPVRTSDLMLDRLDYTINGEEFSYAEGGIACPGERFILSIKGPGQVTSGYAR